jgi:hypothetical protein
MDLDQNTIIGIAVSAILAYLMPKLSPHIDRYFKKSLATPLKGYFRKNRLNKLREFRNTRRNTCAITMQIVKTNAYYILFWGGFTVFFFTILITKSVLPSFNYKNFVLFLITLSPVLMIEIKWLIEESKMKSLVKGRGKLDLWKAAQVRRKEGLDIDFISNSRQEKGAQ